MTRQRRAAYMAAQRARAEVWNKEERVAYQIRVEQELWLRWMDAERRCAEQARAEQERFEDERREEQRRERGRRRTWSDISGGVDRARALVFGLAELPDDGGSVVKAYRRAARRCHPDAGGVAAEFVELTRARDALVACGLWT